MGNYFAIFASSLLFSLMHGNLINILPSFCLGVFLAVVTMRFNSILPALIIHIAINLQTVALRLVPVQYSWVIGLSCVVLSRPGAGRADPRTAEPDHRAPGSQSVGLGPAVLSVLVDRDHAGVVSGAEHSDNQALNETGLTRFFDPKLFCGSG